MDLNSCRTYHKLKEFAGFSPLSKRPQVVEVDHKVIGFIFFNGKNNGGMFCSEKGPQEGDNEEHFYIGCESLEEADKISYWYLVNNAFDLKEEYKNKDYMQLGKLSDTLAQTMIELWMVEHSK